MQSTRPPLSKKSRPTNAADSLQIPIIGMDKGASGIRIATGPTMDHVREFPSYLKKVEEGISFNSLGISDPGDESDTSIKFEYQGQFYSMGEDAIDRGGRLVADARKLDNLLLGFLGAATYLKLEGPVCVALPLPFYSDVQFAADKEVAINALSGRHTWIYDNQSAQVELTPDNIYIIPEGVGPGFYYQRACFAKDPINYPDLSDQCFVVSDLGYKTLDIAYFRKKISFSVGASRSIDFGMSDFYKIVAGKVKESDPSLPAFIDAVHSDRHKYRKNRGVIDLSPILPAAIDEFKEKLETQIYDLLPADADTVLVSGRGGEYMFEHLAEGIEKSERTATLVKDPEFSSAIGGYIHAYLMHKHRNTSTRPLIEEED